MKYIVIDDKEKFAKALCEKLNGEHNCETKECLKFSSEISPAKLVDKIKKEISQDDVILINLNLEVGKNTRQLHKGVKLLKLLRLEKYHAHCILYSFQNFLQILKSNPLNSILHSKGVTFIQLPFLPSKILQINNTEKADKQNLLPFFRAEVDLLKIRHELANIYGVQKISEFHSQICPAFRTQILTQSNSYTYKLIEYLQGTLQQSNKFIIPQKTSEQLKKALCRIFKYKARVFYLDDQAKVGWFDFLKSIIGDSLEQIDFQDSDTEQTLFTKFDRLQNGQPVDLFICDLRLKAKEEDVLDFKELISYKLIEKVRDANPKQKVMYFSATNDLNKYKSLFEGGLYNNPNKYKPHYIFTKEGIDQNYTEESSFHNYKNLIDFLDAFLKGKWAINNIQSLSLFDLLKAEQIRHIATEIEKLKSGTEIKESRFEKFDLVIFDTNAFYQPDISIQILRHIHQYPEKSCIHLSVFAEIKNFANVHKDNADKEVQWLLATKCSDYFEQSKFSISEECMKTEDISKAKKFELEKDYADNILIELCKEKCKTLNVLFVSNDKAAGIRKRSSDKDGPVPQLQKWIKYNNITNLTISSVNNFISKSNNPKIIGSINHDTKANLTAHFGSQEQLNKQKLLKKSDKENVRIKWKDCNFNENNRALQFKINGNSKIVMIGNDKIDNFRTAFQRLKETDDCFEVDETKFGLLSIWGLSKIIKNSL